jgi:hypothetical protein
VHRRDDADPRAILWIPEELQRPVQIHAATGESGAHARP